MKRFITSAEHDMAENIFHLVLAIFLTMPMNAFAWQSAALPAGEVLVALRTVRSRSET